MLTSLSDKVTASTNTIEDFDQGADNASNESDKLGSSNESKGSSNDDDEDENLFYEF